jgi:REP element-mobilizing transposase RayT
VKRYNPEIHHRRSVRLKGYDYSAEGMYFVTVCTQEYENLFGGITDNHMRLNDAGRVVEKIWRALPDRFPMVALDEYIVMPNHFHGIIIIINENGSDPVRALLAAPSTAAPTQAGNQDLLDIDEAKNIGKRMGLASRGENRCGSSGLEKKGAASSFEKKGAASSARTTTLGEIMRAFKSIAAIEINRILDRGGMPVWHRNYFERIIRDERELNNIREYISTNPARWAEDPENRQGQQR